jgi:hypothetical protein
MADVQLGACQAGSCFYAVRRHRCPGNGVRASGRFVNYKRRSWLSWPWFWSPKANHYSKATPLGSWTTAEVGQITNFERTKCGIKF